MASQEIPMDNLNDVAALEQTTKRTRKPKVKSTDSSGSTASLFGFAPYQEKKNEEKKLDETVNIVPCALKK